MKIQFLFSRLYCSSTLQYWHLATSAAYNYKYTVDANGLYFGAQERTDGFSTIGQYHVLLPDGRIQTVNYRVNDNSGFVANVKYSEGIANYAQSPVHHPVALDAIAISAAKSAAKKAQNLPFFPLL